ncbi:MAG TPA: ParB/RepB/Spo0J family partition protein, partial [Pseudomonadales bacterium]|nr:ParB/RepB/Spo0J family partition protein [Pseudomonadales bacterium]
EEAMALQRLQQEFGLTQQLVAEAVGKSRSTVTNLLRLTSLAEPVKRLLEHGDLEMGHARALLALSNDKQIDSARLVVAKGLSVRQTEALVRKQLHAKETVENVKINPDVKALEQRLAERLGARVVLQNNAKGKGKVVIHYNSLDELDGILEHIR